MEGALSVEYTEYTESAMGDSINELDDIAVEEVDDDKEQSANSSAESSRSSATRPP